MIYRIFYCFLCIPLTIIQLIWAIPAAIISPVVGLLIYIGFAIYHYVLYGSKWKLRYPTISTPNVFDYKSSEDWHGEFMGYVVEWPICLLDWLRKKGDAALRNNEKKTH